MNSAIRAVIMTAVLIGFGYFTNELKRYWWYALIFFSFWFIEWYFTNSAHAYEYTQRASIEISYLMQEPYAALDAKTRKQYQVNADYHTKQAIEEYTKAKNICWYLPRQSEREKARKVLTSFAAIMYPGTPLHRGIAALITLMTQYGLDCIEEWYNIKDLLESAQYNSEMAQVYNELLNND